MATWGAASRRLPGFPYGPHFTAAARRSAAAAAAPPLAASAAVRASNTTTLCRKSRLRTAMEKLRNRDVRMCHWHFVIENGY